MSTVCPFYRIDFVADKSQFSGTALLTWSISTTYEENYFFIVLLFDAQCFFGWMFWWR
jgi:hypothetical protein